MYALFDADILVFRCGFAAERRHWFLKVGEEQYDFEYKREATDKLDQLLPGVYSREEGKDYQMWSEVNLEPLGHALQNVKTTVTKCLEAVQCDGFDAKLYLSGKSNFRDKIAVTRPYKGNRDRSHRPTYEKEIRAFMIQNYDCYIAENEEADDMLGIAQTRYGPEDSVIISIDKDLDQIPGLKYNLMHDVAYNITERQAVYNFHLQLLTGDTTDNIPGLPGIGPGKARKALHGLETERALIEECHRMYQVHSGHEDWAKYMKEQGQLLWIRRVPDEMWMGSEEIVSEDGDWGDIELTLEVDDDGTD